MFRTADGKPTRVPRSTASLYEAYHFQTIQHAIDVRSTATNPFSGAGIAEIVRLDEVIKD